LTKKEWYRGIIISSLLHRVTVQKGLFVFLGFFKRRPKVPIFSVGEAPGHTQKSAENGGFCAEKVPETRIKPWPTTKMFHVKHFNPFDLQGKE